MSFRIIKSAASQDSNTKSSAGGGEEAFHPVRAHRPHEDVIAQIVQAIRVGTYRTGNKLPSERDLAEALGVSRQTVREAVRVLMTHDILRVEQGRNGGAYVCTDNIPLNVTSRGRAIEAAEVEEWLEAWRMMAPRVAQLAGMRARPDDLAYLEDILQDMRGALDDEARFHLLEEKFQIGIARAARNGLLLKWVQTMLELNVNAPDFSLAETPADSSWAVDSLTKILGAIARRDPEAIDREFDRHLSYLEQTWIRVTGRAPLRQLPEFLLPYNLRSRGS
jgi:GntR family transcriptional repressor for pyruvate dehydrogenase complex